MVKRRRKFSVKPFTKGLRGPGAEPMDAFRRKRNLLSVQALFGVNCRRRRQEGPFSRRKAPVEVAERRCCGRIRTAPVKTGTAYATNVPPARLLYAAALRGSLSARADITLRNENAKTEPFHQKGSVLRITRFPARSPGGTGLIVPPGFAGNIKSGVEF